MVRRRGGEGLAGQGRVRTVFSGCAVQGVGGLHVGGAHGSAPGRPGRLVHQITQRSWAPSGEPSANRSAMLAAWASAPARAESSAAYWPAPAAASSSSRPGRVPRPGDIGRGAQVGGGLQRPGSARGSALRAVASWQVLTAGNSTAGGPAGGSEADG